MKLATEAKMFSIVNAFFAAGALALMVLYPGAALVLLLVWLALA